MATWFQRHIQPLERLDDALIEFVIAECKLQTKEGVNTYVYIEWNEEFES